MKVDCFCALIYRLPRFINDSDLHVPASIQLQNDRPVSSPYKFGFDDRYLGGRIARHEEFDGIGRVTGFYTIEDPDGRKRLVKYVADENGFRASVVTNEQGKLFRLPNTSGKYNS